MLLLIHNIHSALNLNSLSSMEQYYSFNINKDIEDSSVNNSNLDTQYLKSISSLFIDSNISFSF
jgi:hypothetical protein